MEEHFLTEIRMGQERRMRNLLMVGKFLVTRHPEIPSSQVPPTQEGAIFWKDANEQSRGRNLLVSTSGVNYLLAKRAATSAPKEQNPSGAGLLSWPAKTLGPDVFSFHPMGPICQTPTNPQGGGGLTAVSVCSFGIMDVVDYWSSKHSIEAGDCLGFELYRDAPTEKYVLEPAIRKNWNKLRRINLRKLITQGSLPKEGVILTQNMLLMLLKKGGIPDTEAKAALDVIMDENQALPTFSEVDYPTTKAYLDNLVKLAREAIVLDDEEGGDSGTPTEADDNPSKGKGKAKASGTKGGDQGSSKKVLSGFKSDDEEEEEEEEDDDLESLGGQFGAPAPPSKKTPSGTPVSSNAMGDIEDELYREVVASLGVGNYATSRFFPIGFALEALERDDKVPSCHRPTPLGLNADEFKTGSRVRLLLNTLGQVE
jgi:hypothetical protein